MARVGALMTLILHGACLQAIDNVSQLFQGNLPELSPDPYPGVITYKGSEHPNPKRPRLSTEFQVCWQAMKEGLCATYQRAATSCPPVCLHPTRQCD